MPYKITITEDDERQLRVLPVREQRILEAAIRGVAQTPLRLGREATRGTSDTAICKNGLLKPSVG